MIGLIGSFVASFGKFNVYMDGVMKEVKERSELHGGWERFEIAWLLDSVRWGRGISTCGPC